MLLNDTEIEAVRESIGAEPVSDDHPAMTQLVEVFGEHSFYVDTNGLSIFATEEEVEEIEGTPRLTLIAAWADEKKTALQPVQPTDMGLPLPQPGPEDGAA